MNNIETLKIEVYDLREKLQMLSNKIQEIQKKIADKVITIREMEEKDNETHIVNSKK